MRFGVSGLVNHLGLCAQREQGTTLLLPICILCTPHLTAPELPPFGNKLVSNKYCFPEFWKTL